MTKSMKRSSILLELFAEASLRGGRAHERFLSTRQAGLLGLQELIEMQMRGSSVFPPHRGGTEGGALSGAEAFDGNNRPSPGLSPPGRGTGFPPLRGGTEGGAISNAEASDGSNTPSPGLSPSGRGIKPLYTTTQLAEFATGQVSGCFGPEFAVFDGVRVPRIPSGELMLMSRIVEIQGSRRQFRPPASLVAEYDVPQDAWFYRDSQQTSVPVSVYMEMALQPCGFLSAHLGAFWLFPGEIRFFRNLDGSGRVVDTVDLRGKTVVTKATMRSHVVHFGTVVQRYNFELTCQGRTIYQGESNFGYFPVDAMEKQVGLDGGAPAPTWLQQNPAAQARALSLGPETLGRFAPPHLQLINQAACVPGGGRYGQGYVYASQPVNPSDWFYRCHFKDDPVMPGSLGVEAAVEAVRVFAHENGLDPAAGRVPEAFLVENRAMSWKYRGQVLPDSRQMSLEAHIKEANRRSGETALTFDASVWSDGLRIYEIKNASILLK